MKNGNMESLLLFQFFFYGICDGQRINNLLMVCLVKEAEFIFEFNTHCT